MRIALTYNVRTEDTEAQAELLTQEDVDRMLGALRRLDHEVFPIEVSGPPDEAIDRLIEARPDLVFNVAEGTGGKDREARFPAIFDTLGLAYTGGRPSLLLVDLDKRLSERILAVRGIRAPRGALLTGERSAIPEGLEYPLIAKPNYEGSGKGISQRSICETPEEARELTRDLLDRFPDGVVLEEFITGRELSIPMLEAFPGGLLEIVEHTFHQKQNGGDPDRYNIYDYDLKRSGNGRVQIHVPPKLTPQERQEVLSLADRVFRAMPCPDLGRVDVRLREDGRAYFIEINPLPALHPEASLMQAARARGLDYDEVFRLIIRSASRRHGIFIRTARRPRAGREPRRTAREHGLTIGRFSTGQFNAITDVHGVRVGHVTQIRDDVPVPEGNGETTSVRTGITAVVPEEGRLFNQHLIAGGFILNGIGEMSGLTQAMEWGWLETPILLTNTMSVGLVHAGIIQHVIRAYPELGRKVDVIIPLVGETNDAFLNDVRVLCNTPELAMEAIDAAHGGPVEQGSVGGGTGMITFDFAGGIGSASRRVSKEDGGYTVGVLVQSNFGKMRNLTVDGAVVGRELDPLFPYDGRRRKTYGSIIVVVATDAPLMSPQLGRLAKRAALGLGRVGSFAASTSGEIVFAFSTGNRTSREAKEQSRILNFTFVSDDHVNALYEAVSEATEEAVLNAIFCSAGMTGRAGRFAPPLPPDEVFRCLAKGRQIRPPPGREPDERPPPTVH